MFYVYFSQSKKHNSPFFTNIMLMGNIYIFNVIMSIRLGKCINIYPINKVTSL